MTLLIGIAAYLIWAGLIANWLGKRLQRMTRPL